MKRIVCPVNFTATALNALEFASNLAKMHGAALSLLHVVTDEEYNRLLETDEKEDIRLRIEKEKDLLQREMESLCREIDSSYPGIKCDYAFGYGDLSTNVVEFAATGGYHLIVMGNDGVENITEAMDGSSTVKVIEKAPCAVLSVPGEADFKGFSKVVFGTEFRKADREALIRLNVLLKPAGSSIHVVHITKSGADSQLASLRNKIEELKTYLNYSEIQFHIQEYQEGVRFGLNSYMEEMKGDMLVLVTHQRNFLERIFQESVSKRISYFAGYPMLIYLEEHL